MKPYRPLTVLAKILGLYTDRENILSDIYAVFLIFILITICCMTSLPHFDFTTMAIGILELLTNLTALMTNVVSISRLHFYNKKIFLRLQRALKDISKISIDTNREDSMALKFIFLHLVILLGVLLEVVINSARRMDFYFLLSRINDNLNLCFMIIIILQLHQSSLTIFRGCTEFNRKIKRFRDTINFSKLREQYYSNTVNIKSLIKCYNQISKARSLWSTIYGIELFCIFLSMNIHLIKTLHTCVEFGMITEGTMPFRLAIMTIFASHSILLLVSYIIS